MPVLLVVVAQFPESGNHCHFRSIRTQRTVEIALSSLTTKVETFLRDNFCSKHFEPPAVRSRQHNLVVDFQGKIVLIADIPV